MRGSFRIRRSTAVRKSLRRGRNDSESEHRLTLRLTDSEPPDEGRHGRQLDCQRSGLAILVTNGCRDRVAHQNVASHSSGLNWPLRADLFGGAASTGAHPRHREYLMKPPPYRCTGWLVAPPSPALPSGC